MSNIPPLESSGGYGHKVMKIIDIKPGVVVAYVAYGQKPKKFYPDIWLYLPQHGKWVRQTSTMAYTGSRRGFKTSWWRNQTSDIEAIWKTVEDCERFLIMLAKEYFDEVS